MSATVSEDVEAGNQVLRATRFLEACLARLPITHPLYRPARLLRDLMDRDPERAVSMTLGATTPKGAATFETLVRERKAKTQPVAAPVRRGKRANLDQPPTSDVRAGIRFYAIEDPVETPHPDDPNNGMLKIIEQPAEGGECVPSTEFLHHKLRYPTLNPVQSLVVPWVTRGVNLIVAARTSAGKTVVAEMVMADALARGGKAVFLSPLRAVTQEKYDEWTHESHPWAKKRVEIVTGDYVLTDARKKALKVADVILLTTEMLDSRTRRMQTEGNDWLLAVLVVVIDEAHLLTMEDRGDALEAGLMRFTKQNPQARVVKLSATMPNVDELGGWVTSLNQHPTVMIRSAWRPTKLTVHWPTYDDHGHYHQIEEAKRAAATKILFEHPDDKFIMFVHSKDMGRKLMLELHHEGVKAQFHSADLNRDARLKLEKDFRDGDLRVVIATSTLAYGVNMPARRVVVLGVHRGMDEVSPLDVAQECGRAGRMGLDPEGDAYVLIPASRAVGVKSRFSNVGDIESKMNDVDTLAFHLCAEVAEQGVSTEAQAVAWHGRSFAAFRGDPLVEKIELPPIGTPERAQALASMNTDKLDLTAASIMERLSKVGILRRDQDGHYAATMLGRVSSWLYYSPFDIADWASNFRKLVELDRIRDDTCIAWALGTVKTQFKGWIPRDAERELGQYTQRLRAKGIEVSRIPGAPLVYEAMLQGRECKALVSDHRKLHHDTSRLVQALEMIDRYVLKSLGDNYTKLLGLRLSYGVGWREAELCVLPGVGAVRAAKLVEAGITSINHVLERPNTVTKVLGAKVALNAIRGAKGIMRERGNARD